VLIKYTRDGSFRDSQFKGFGNLAMTIGHLDNVKNALKVGTISAAAAGALHLAQTKQPLSSSSNTTPVEVTP
jgi:hypothetical protein